MSIFRNFIEKNAALRPEIKLHDHQQKAVDATGNNVIYAHATGSGKTLTGIAKFEKLKEQGKASKALVVVPASLRENFAREGVSKFTDGTYNIVGTKDEIRKQTAGNISPDVDYNIISYDMFRKNPEKFILESGADTLVTDESHKGKNEGTLTTKSLLSPAVRSHIKNSIGLTGSITSNTPADLVPLVQQVSLGRADVGKDKNDFLSRFVVRDDSKVFRSVHESRRPIIGFKNKKALKKELGSYIHYLGHDDIKETANMPDSDIEVVKVPLSKDQTKLYKKMLRDDPNLRKMITAKRLETLKDDEASRAYSQLIEMRKLMNDPSSVVGGEFNGSPKLDRMVDDLEKHLATTPDGQAILFSHLINGGIGSIEEELKSRNLDYSKFIGKGNDGITEESRQKAVRDYNDRLKRILLVSSAGGEGISLGDTTFEGVLDPHFNPERMQQMEARGVRSGGLSHRPKKERVVDVNRYLATMPKTLGIFKSNTLTPDEAIYMLAEKKRKQNEIVHALLKEVRKEQENALVKTASIEKLQKKRYWQYLKRLYGGGESAVKAISETGDSGIYHGTAADAIPSILENGLNQRRYREFGDGTFFGDRHTSGLYSRNKITDLDGIEHRIDDPSVRKWIDSGEVTAELESILQKRGLKLREGSRLRFLKPSELSRKDMYPDPQNAAVFGIKKGEPLSSVAPQAGNVFSKEIRDQAALDVKKLSDSQLDDVILEANGSDAYLKLSKKWKENRAEMHLHRKRVDDALMPKTDDDFYKMKHYGKTGFGRAFDVFETPSRNEFFIEGDVAPNLLKRAGVDMSLFRTFIEKTASSRVSKYLREADGNPSLLNSRLGDVFRKSRGLGKMKGFSWEDSSKMMESVRKGEVDPNLIRGARANFGGPSVQRAKDIGERMDDMDEKIFLSKKRDRLRASRASDGIDPVTGEDYIDIIHGGQKQVIDSFLKGGNAHTQTENFMLTPRGNGLSKDGLMFHSKIKDRAKPYSEMSTSQRFGDPAILTGRIKKKYLYHNQGDEYSLPKHLYDKIEDSKVFTKKDPEYFKFGE